MAATERDFATITHDKNGRVIPGICGVWSGLDNDDTGKWVRVASLPDKSVQLQGTPGASLTLKIQGYNGADPSNGSGGFLTYDGLTDIVLAAAGDIAYIAEHVTWIRPIASGGDGTTNVSVTLMAGG